MKELAHTKFQRVVWLSRTALIGLCLALAVHRKVNWHRYLPTITVGVIRMLESGGPQSTPADGGETLVLHGRCVPAALRPFLLSEIYEELLAELCCVGDSPFGFAPRGKRGRLSSRGQ
jgi:hypothetical protein